MVRLIEQAPSSPKGTRWRPRVFFLFLALSLIYILLSSLVGYLTRNTPQWKLKEDGRWIASSRFWLDRQLCRFIGCCGTLHMLNPRGWTWPNYDQHHHGPDPRDFHGFWQSGTEEPDHWSKSERAKREIPQFVLDHAPYVHLSSAETYWPSDLAEHLMHTTPYLNYTRLGEFDKKVDLANLSILNQVEVASHGKTIYLHSDDNIEDVPRWLSSAYNMPSSHSDAFSVDMDSDAGFALNTSTDGRCSVVSGITSSSSKFGKCCSIFGYCATSDSHCGYYCDSTAGNCHRPVKAGTYGPRLDLRKRMAKRRSTLANQGEIIGHSKAPAILIVVPKDDGVLDAFWFFFYSYNLGKVVLNIRFGNHVGDWEHSLVRFKNGKPEQVFLSEHSWGEAYEWDAIEKYIPSMDGSGTMLSSIANASYFTPASAHAQRPVVFSAEGSHAMYGTAGFHPYVAPFGILHDDTDRGPLWDPAANVKSFTMDVKNKKLRSSTRNPEAPTEWFDFKGHWGDKNYLLRDPRQYRFAGEYHYLSGPLGPRYKDLDREEVCQGKKPCELKQWLGERQSEHELAQSSSVEDDVSDADIAD